MTSKAPSVIELNKDIGYALIKYDLDLNNIDAWVYIWSKDNVQIEGHLTLDELEKLTGVMKELQRNK